VRPEETKLQAQQNKVKPKNARFIPRGSTTPVDSTAPFPQPIESFCTDVGAF
jgi:hypothetical protein